MVLLFEAFFCVITSLLLTNALYSKREEMTCKKEACDMHCTKNATHGCWETCQSQKCGMYCADRPFCWQICNSTFCEMMAVRARESHQICTGARHCLDMLCYNCTLCQQRLINEGDVDFAMLGSATCSFAKKCIFYCRNQTCALTCRGRKAILTAINARVHLELSKQVKTLKVDCRGVRSICFIYYKERRINIKSTCSQGCGTVVHQYDGTEEGSGENGSKGSLSKIIKGERKRRLRDGFDERVTVEGGISKEDESDWELKADYDSEEYIARRRRLPKKWKRKSRSSVASNGKKMPFISSRLRKVKKWQKKSDNYNRSIDHVKLLPRGILGSIPKGEPTDAAFKAIPVQDLKGEEVSTDSFIKLEEEILLNEEGRNRNSVRTSVETIVEPCPTLPQPCLDVRESKDGFHEVWSNAIKIKAMEVLFGLQLVVIVSTVVILTRM